MKKVLLVDDMPTVLDQAGDMMKDRYELVTCSDTTGLKEKVKSEKPDIILLDLYLADDEAYELLKALQEDKETADIPVITTGADASVLVISKAFFLGAVDFVRKPFIEHVLFQKIDSRLKLAEIGYRFEG